MRLGGSVMNPYNSPEEWLAQVKELGYSAVIFPVNGLAEDLMHNGGNDGKLQIFLFGDECAQSVYLL